MNNATVLLAMIGADLPGFVLGSLGDSLSLLFCRSNPDCDENNPTDEQCRSCVERWLAQPYAGDLIWREGRIERAEG